MTLQSHVRNANIALQVGEFVDLDPDNADALIFERRAGGQTCVVAINFSAESAALPQNINGRVLLSTHDRRNQSERQLAGFEILIVKLYEQ